MTPAPDHAALLCLLTLAERDMPKVVCAVRSIHARHGIGSQAGRVEFARALVRQMRADLDGVEHLLDQTLERLER